LQQINLYKMDSATKKKLLGIFARLYPDPKSELNFNNEYELLVSVILSAQCTDKKVNQTTPLLFKKYPSFIELSKARAKALEKVIGQINYYRTKTKHLIAMATMVVNEHKNKVPRSRAKLISLPGVGQKTANVILSELQIEPAFPVDTHVYRLARRLGLSAANSTDRVEEDLKKEFDSEKWRELHHWLIFHGRRVCKAQRPLCERCQLSNICPSNKKTPS